MKPGNLVEYAVVDGHRLGAVIDVIGKTKLLVVPASGDDNRPERDDVTFVIDDGFETIDRETARAAVKSLELKVTRAEHRIDLAGIWALAAGGDSYDVADLALLNGLGEPAGQIALARLLREDETYFRHRKGRFEARSIDQVDEQIQRQELAANRGARRRDFVTRVAGILALDAASRATAFIGAEAGDAEFADWAELIRGFAADEAEFPRREEAEALLDEIVRESGLRLSARAAPRGFEFMLELGLWREHEVVAIHRFGLPLDHGDATNALGDAAAQAGFARDGREDFTGWWSLTIDDVDSLDFDDGLSIRPTLDGGWEVAVHIADPDAYVPAGSALDDEARRRASSMYLPDRVIPMFPPALSERSMSLVQDEERPAMTTHVLFDADLELVEWRIAPSIVRMNRRLSYDEADRLLEGHSADHTSSVLRDLAFIADELHARRLAGGARPIELPEPRVRVVFEEGEPKVALSIQEQSTARSLVAEFMVFVGELTARWCIERDIPIIFRTQDPPHAERSDDQIQRIPEGWAREFAVLMTMRRGDLTTVPGPHAALGLDLYAQATSPIRRYGDLIVQRQIKAALRGAELPYDLHDVYRVAQTVERANHEVATAEREAAAYWIHEYFHRHEGDEVEAVVVAARDDGSRRAEVILRDSGFRTVVRFRSRPDLGDTVRLRIDRARARPAVLVLEEL